MMIISNSGNANNSIIYLSNNFLDKLNTRQPKFTIKSITPSIKSDELVSQKPLQIIPTENSVPIKFNKINQLIIIKNQIQQYKQTY